jgi:hypothetical protein
VRMTKIRSSEIIASAGGLVSQKDLGKYIGIWKASRYTRLSNWQAIADHYDGGPDVERER